MDRPWERLLREMNDCPPLQKTLAGLPPLCEVGKTLGPPEAVLVCQGCEEGHFPVLIASMVGAGSAAPRQTWAASSTWGGEPLAAIHFPPGLDLGPPLPLLLPLSALDQEGVPFGSYPLST